MDGHRGAAGRHDGTEQRSGLHRPQSLALVAYRVAHLAAPLVAAPTARDWMSATDRRFASRCLPLLIANESGWLLLNVAAFTAVWSGHRRVDALRLVYDDPGAPRLAASYFGYGIITWTVPYLFRTPPGFNLLVRGPANMPKDGVSPLEGVVETDWATATFTMNWMVTRPGTPIRFEVDEAFAMIVPQRRGELEAFEPEIRDLGEDAELQSRHVSWSASRRRFLDALSTTVAEGGPGWQRDYFQGRHVDGSAAEEPHQTRRRLKDFRAR